MPVAESGALSAFAAELRAQRTRLGWTQEMLAAKIGYSGSFVSDVERGMRTPALDFAQGCDREMKLPGTFERLHDLLRRAVYPTWFSPVVDLEREAVRIHGWVHGAVPGLLQTEDYARALISVSNPQASADSVRELVEGRLARQEVLCGESPPMLWYVLDEAVLRRGVGGPAVMAAQLDRLIEMISARGIVIQVLAFDAQDYAGTDGPVTIFDRADGSPVGYTECFGGGRVVERSEEVAGLVTVVGMLRASALSPRMSGELIRQIRRGLDG